MSQFQAIKCDECGHIQGEANHWTRMTVWIEGATIRGILLGDAVERWTLNFAKPMEFPSEVQKHDLCGQGCAMKHIAKLLGWNAVASEL